MKPGKFLCFNIALVLGLLWSVGAALAGPCDLITKPEAEAILGEQVQEPTAKKVVGMVPGLSCVYRTAAPLAKRGGVGTIKLIVYDAKTMKENDRLFDSPAAWFKKYFKARRTGGEDVVPHLGDEARWTPDSDSLHVLVKGVYLVLQIKDLVKMEAKNRAELAKKVSAHRKQKSIQAMTDYILPRLK